MSNTQFGSTSYPPGTPQPNQPQTTAPGVMSPRNDIADFLKSIAGMFGGAFGEFLLGIANWFENLDPDGTKPWALQAAVMLAANEQAGKMKTQGITEWLGINECLAASFNSARQDLQEAGMLLAAKVPQRLQEFIDCWLNRNPQARQALSTVNSQNFGPLIVCAIPAVMTWIRTRDIGAAVTQFFTCMMGGGGGGGGGNPTTGPFHDSVPRCS